MAICGVDIGNLSMLISQTSKGGVDVILNDASNRQTATCISVQGKQRFIGDSGAALARTNVLNTVTGMKLLCGRFYDDPDVQAELAKYPFKTVKMPHGGVGVVVTYNDEPKEILPEHLVAIMLNKAVTIVKDANAGLNMADCVLAVPYWYTDLQRRSLMQSCEIAGVHCLKIVNEPTAIALSFGIYKSAKGLFHATDPVNVMFIDIGYTCYTVTIVSFLADGMKVLSTQCDAKLGGRDIDNVIVEFLAEKFEKTTGINVRNNKKAMLKLLAAAEKGKKTLSPHGVSEASISVECLAEDRDLSCILTLEEFEKRMQPLVDKLPGPIEACLAESGVALSSISEVEVVGGSTRVNILKKRLAEILKLDTTALNYGLKTTMNSDEAVVRGCALQCAIESSRIKVKPFNIVDRLTYGLVVSFDEGSADADSVEIYARGDEVPRKPKRLTFKRKDKNDFVLRLSYSDDAVKYLPAGASRKVADFTVRMPNPFPVEEGVDASQPNDVRVTFNLDKNGCAYVSKAELMVEIAGESKESTSMDVDGEGKAEEKGESKDETAMDVENAPAKRKFRKVDLVVDCHVHGILGKQQIKDAIELEASMAFEDLLIKETGDKRNELEAYIYAMRDKMIGSLKRFASDSDAAKLKEQVNQCETWLYGDGYDATKNQYTKKLEELQSFGRPIESRSWEEANRPAAVDQLKVQIERCRTFCASQDEAHAHITQEDRDVIRKEVDATETWMFDMQGKQGELKVYENPVLTVALVNARRQQLHNKSHPIMTKPKPKPAEVKPEAKAEAKAEEKAPETDSKMDVEGEGAEGKADAK